MDARRNVTNNDVMNCTRTMEVEELEFSSSVLLWVVVLALLMVVVGMAVSSVLVLLLIVASAISPIDPINSVVVEEVVWLL